MKLLHREKTVIYVLFPLGLLCFILPWYVPLTGHYDSIVFIAVAMMYALFLCDAALSLKLRANRKGRISKGIISFLCCIFQMPFAGRLLSRLSMPEPITGTISSAPENIPAIENIFSIMLIVISMAVLYVSLMNTNSKAATDSK